MTPSGVLTTLVEFDANNSQNPGYWPYTGLIQGSDGSFYGTTAHGGRSDSGTVFRATASGTLSTLVEFSGTGSSDIGESPEGALVQGNDGNFYGTTHEGGIHQRGTVFKITPSGRLNTLVNFDLESSWPMDGLVKGMDGDLYGTTRESDTLGGAIFRATSSGVLANLLKFNLLYDPIDYGFWPESGLVQGNDGNFYGTTTKGGAYNLGTVFRITPDGEFSTLVEFTGDGSINRGAIPEAALLQGIDGNFYGTTTSGGASGNGTVFRMTPTGSLTTLVDFTYNGSSYTGGEPKGRLIQSADGNLYGTTSGGGIYGRGTVFSISSTGNFTTLMEFPGDELNLGAEPVSGLMQAADGNFYGTTAYGGESDFGTVFRMTPSGTFTTLAEFTTAEDGKPTSELIQGSDGNLYGTTSGGLETGAGIVYRLVFPGVPIIGVSGAEIGTNESVLEGRVNPRGSSTVVHLEYGYDGVSFPNSILIQLNLDGFQSRPVSGTIRQLDAGTTYYYRFRAVSSEGEAITPVESFTTLAPPVTSAGPATEILPTSARLNGTVDPRNYDATVRFEWGTDGNSFPNSLAADPGSVTGNTPTSVSASLAGLTKGTTYFYRVVATNDGGTTVSGTQSFRTLTDPTVTIGGSFALSTTSVRVEGAVDPEGSDSNVVFEYSDDGWDSFEIKPAAQGTQSGNGIRLVSAVLTNLQQGVTYHYRLRATSDGGSGVSSTNSFSMNVLSGFDRVAPGAPPEAEGFLLVNLSPAGLLHGWRFVGETRWRDSGVAVGGLPRGDRLVEFRPVAGHVHPPVEQVDIRGGGAATVLDRTYFETGAAGSGGLTVTLKPDSITTGEGRARWRLVGETDNAWRDSGATLSALPAGDYVVECSPVPGRSTPRETSVVVSPGQTLVRTLAYLEAGAFTGETASPLAFETVVQEPYAYVGQIRGSAGSGSGFVVKERVVATAAHVVWDEATFAAAGNVQWLQQRHAGAYEPQPLQPRGFYLLSGYADRRVAEATPGSFSPESRNLDVAALFFRGQTPGRDGFSGFLASDLDNNEFLLSNANKMIAGYPLDGVAPASQGRMHATSPFNVPFTAVGPAANRTFLTAAIRSSGGASGGPLLVQFEGGAYFPAAIYLGGSAQTVVRTIDSEVIELFNAATHSSTSDEPYVGGGVTRTDVAPLPGEGGRGGLRVLIQPASVLAKGARWRLKPETAYRNSGDQKGELAPGSYRLEFASVAGFQTPPLLQVQVRANQLTTLTFTYALPPVLGPEIVVRGRGRDLPDGDLSPSALDGTDFGVAAVEGATSIRTFAVFNTGNRALSLGTPAFSGDHAADFEVTTSPAPSVAPGGSTSFTVRFDPSAPGVRTTTLSLPNNDANENPFNFALQGNHVADANSNGFSDVEEAALDALLATFTVGQRVDLDLSFLRLGNGHTLALTGLPPGLIFNPATKRLTGTILGKPAPGHLLRKMDGATELGSRAFDLRVFFPARLVVSTAPRRFAPTLVNRRSAAQFVRLTNSGELPLQRLAVRLGGTAPNDFLLPLRPPATLQPGASATVSVVFRPLGRGTRLGSLVITSNAAPKSVPLSGLGQ